MEQEISFEQKLQVLDRAIRLSGDDQNVTAISTIYKLLWRDLLADPKNFRDEPLTESHMDIVKEIILEAMRNDDTFRSALAALLPSRLHNL